MKMLSRPVWVTLLAATFVGVCLGTFFHIYRYRLNFAQIEEGMTKEQIIKLLGRPHHSNFGRWPPGPNWVDGCTWYGMMGSVSVYFKCPAPNLAKGLLTPREQTEEETNRERIVF